MLILILKDRVALHSDWFDRLKTEVNELETSTGMIRPTWTQTLTAERARFLSNYDNLLRVQHAVHTELCHCETVLTFLIKFSDFCLTSLQRFEELRQVSSHASYNKTIRLLEEDIKFIAGRTNLVQDKQTEMLNRIRGQINVVRARTMLPRSCH